MICQVSSAALGKLLFQEQASECRSATFSARLQDVLLAFENMSAATKAHAVAGTRAQLNALAEEVAADPCFKAEVVSTIRVLGVGLRIPTGDPFIQAMFRLEACLRSHSVAYKGECVLCPHEQWMLGSRSGCKAPIPRVHMADNDSAREHFWVLAQRAAATMLCQFIPLVENKKNVKRFLEFDNYFLLEIAILQSTKIHSMFE